LRAARDCILYARYSTDRQNPKSCEDQLREARQYATAAGWCVVGQYQDAGISGTKGRADRQGWDQLLEFIERGGLKPGAVVLTWDIDRWSRDWADGMIEALRLHKLGVDLADTKDGVLEQAGLAGKVMLTLKVAGADEFIQKLRRNVKRGLVARREAGYWTWPAPIGYTTVRTGIGSVLDPVPAEAAVVREIFEQLDAGQTPAAIARRLNSAGVVTKRGLPWSPTAIRHVGGSVVYLGQIGIFDSRAAGKRRPTRSIPKDQVRIIPGLHPPIIPQDLWDRVQARLREVPRGPNALSVRPLSGLVVCGECGSKCHICGGAWPWQGYSCRWRRKGTDRCTSDRYVEIPRLEDAVRAWVRAVAADPRVIQAAALRAAQEDLVERQRAAVDARPIQAEIRELEHKQERLLDSLYAGSAPALVNERLAQVQVQLEVALARLTAVAPTTAMVDPRAVELALEGILGAGEIDLRMVRGFVGGIELPADPEAPPVLRAFGVAFALEVFKGKRPYGAGMKMQEAVARRIAQRPQRRLT
jgi:site-specific DNA recombinase